MRSSLAIRLLVACFCALAVLSSMQIPRRRPGSFGIQTASAATQSAQVTLSPGYQSPNPGQTASVAAAVTPATGSGPTPTGTITFYDSFAGSNTQLGGSVSLTEGQVTDGWSTLGVGSHSITGQYSGDANYAPATSSPVTILVQKFAPTLTLTVTSTTPAAGGALVATATVAGSQVLPPTGSVTFTVDNSTQGMASLSGAGTAWSARQTLTIATGGSHTIGASYSGDANYGSATAPPITVTTGKLATVTTLAALPTAITAGTPETLTATLAPAAATSAGSTFTGTVTFFDGSTALGTPVTIANNQASLSGVSLSTTTTHSLTAVYSGDANWLGSTSTPLVLSVTGMPATVILTASNPIALAGSLITFTVTVTGPANASAIPSGTIAFDDGGTSAGQATLAAGAGQATATWSTSTLSAGTHQITAHYSGDDSFKAAVSSAVTLAIESFAITPSATSLTLRQGQTGNITYTVAEADSVNAAVQFACTAPPNTFTTCSFGPGSVAGNGQTSLTIITTGPGKAAASNSGLWGKGSAALACLLVLCAPVGMRFHRRLGGAVLPFLLLGILASGLAILSGCGSASRSGAPTGMPTPPGTQVFAITTSTAVNGQTINQDTYVTVNVLPAS